MGNFNFGNIPDPTKVIFLHADNNHYETVVNPNNEYFEKYRMICVDYGVWGEGESHLTQRGVGVAI